MEHAKLEQIDFGATIHTSFHELQRFSRDLRESSTISSFWPSTTWLLQSFGEFGHFPINIGFT
jgi:hypothetical protein